MKNWTGTFLLREETLTDIISGLILSVEWVVNVEVFMWFQAFCLQCEVTARSVGSDHSWGGAEEVDALLIWATCWISSVVWLTAQFRYLISVKKLCAFRPLSHYLQYVRLRLRNQLRPARAWNGLGFGKCELARFNLIWNQSGLICIK